MPPIELGEIFGLITGGSAMLGCVLGGTGSDLAARPYGVPGRLYLALCAALVASVGAALICFAQVATVLVGFGLWTLCLSIGAITGVAVIQNLVPSEYRGSGIAILTFCTTLLGLGFGPTAVTLLTEHVYQSPKSVGYAITTIVLPAGVLAAMLLLISSRAVRVRNLPRNEELC